MPNLTQAGRNGVSDDWFVRRRKDGSGDRNPVGERSASTSRTPALSACGRRLPAGYSLASVSGTFEPVSDIEVDNITAIRVDGIWIEVEPGSISAHQFKVDLSVVAGAGIGFRAIDTPITSRNREATYVLVSAITAVRTREDGPGNLGHSR
jgi:hypothetical protein